MHDDRWSPSGGVVLVRKGAEEQAFDKINNVRGILFRARLNAPAPRLRPKRVRPLCTRYPKSIKKEADKCLAGLLKTKGVFGRRRWSSRGKGVDSHTAKPCIYIYIYIIRVLGKHTGDSLRVSFSTRV